ncbi:bifunctional diguanylate cyclase/phosphodiesterase [Hahella ganghwensis]|uniref:bifunctional diguanylate cyclase/phosphodiesterase n=1 Tax=Hahella ganghwensis TaxID=286420 RepID=UPI0012F89CAE|nr:EAL domain-containing protein [Hahella ganghwensis]
MPNTSHHVQEEPPKKGTFHGSSLVLLAAGIALALTTALFSFNAGYPPLLFPASAVIALLYFHHNNSAVWAGGLLALISGIAAGQSYLTASLSEAASITGLSTAFVAFQSYLFYRAYSWLTPEEPDHRAESTILRFLISLLVSTAACSSLAGLGFTLLLPGKYDLFSLLAMLFLSTALPTLIGFPAYSAKRKSELLSRLLQDRFVEVVAWMGLLLTVGQLITEMGGFLIFALLPLLIWSNLRFTQYYSNLAASVAGITVLAALHLYPPAMELNILNLLHLEVAVFVFSSYYLGALTADRVELENRLEEMVIQRTRDLEMTNYELQNEVAIRQKAEKSFRQSSRRYRALIETAGSPIVVMDNEFRILQWNDAAARLFGYNREDIYGRSYIEGFVPSEFRDETEWKIKKVLETGIPVENFETEANALDGSKHVMLWNINRVVDEEDEHPQVVLVGQNITPIRQTQNQLHFLAHYDVLTGAANRRLFEDRCTQALKQAVRHQNEVGLISLDIDHFKRINDTLGHDAGDELLKEICRRLKMCIREEDTIARLGGDEFAILLNKVNGEEGCLRVGRNLLESIIQPINLPSQQLVITTSIGITLAPRDGKDYSVLLKNADMAMYRAKSAGRNNIQLYRKEMNDELELLLNTEQELRAAIEQHQFDIYYQPQIDLESARVIGLEALLRWKHPTRGILAPIEFIDVAEQCGLLPALGQWVIYNACLQCRAIQAMSQHPVKVAVNISPRQFYHPELLNTLATALSETRVDPTYISLEIAESVLLHNQQEAEERLEQLKSLGLQITVDSFGSGLSSVSTLARLPVDALKIDRALVRNVPGQDIDMAISETLVAIAHKMNIKVIIEGVETTDQEAFFRNNGVRLVQGHLYAHPMPSITLPNFFDGLKHGKVSAEGNQIHLPLES